MQFLRTLQCGIDIASTSRVTNRAQVEGGLIIVSTYAIAAELANEQGASPGIRPAAERRDGAGRVRLETKASRSGT